MLRRLFSKDFQMKKSNFLTTLFINFKYIKQGGSKMKRVSFVIVIILCSCSLLFTGNSQAQDLSQYLPNLLWIDFPFSQYPPYVYNNFPYQSRYTPPYYYPSNLFYTGISQFGILYPGMLGYLYPYLGYPSVSTKSSQKKPNLKFSIKTDKSIYSLGEPVIITFQATNKGDAKASINFSSSQKFDVIVKENTESSELVWQLSSHNDYTNLKTTLIIKQDKSVTFEAQWDQKDESDELVPLGSYVIEAFLTPDGDQYKKIVSKRISINSLPRFLDCQELKEKLQESDKSEEIKLSSSSDDGGGSRPFPLPSTSYFSGSVFASAFDYGPYGTGLYGGGGYSYTSPSLGLQGLGGVSVGYGGYAGGLGSVYTTPYSLGPSFGSMGIGLFGLGGYPSLAPSAGVFSSSPYSGIGGYGGFGGGFAFTGGYGYSRISDFSEGSGSGGEESTTEPLPGNGAAEFSTTTLQVTGVDEADIIKNDGSYIYMIKDKTIRIIKGFPYEDLAQVYEISFKNPDFTPTQLYVDGNTMVVIGDEPSGSEIIQYPDGSGSRRYFFERDKFTRLCIFNISNRMDVEEERTLRFEARYVQSRKVNDTLYIIMNEDPPFNLLDKDDLDYRNLLPSFYDSTIHANDEGETICDCSDIAYLPGYTEPTYLAVVGIPLNDKEKPIGRLLILGKSEDVYATTENLYVTSTSYIDEGFPEASTENPEIEIPSVYQDTPSTMVYKFTFDGVSINFKGNAKIPGQIKGRFGLNEYDDHFRIITTSEMPLSNNVYIFDERMKLTGLFEGIAPNEEIKSIRFMGDKCFTVTSSEVAPFSVISLSDPSGPELIGELNALADSEYLHPYDETHIIGFGRKEDINNIKLGIEISLYDMTDATNPTLLDYEYIGAHKTYSEILDNSKALLFSKTKNIMAFPIAVSRHTGGSFNNVEYIFQGAYIFQIDESGIEEKAEITHYETLSSDYPSSSLSPEEDSIKRIIYIGDHYYTISDSMIKAIDLELFSVDNFLGLQ